MINLKRVTIATLSGIGFGVIFYWLICYPFGHIHPWPGIVTIILVRTLMGFTIGISAWKTAWWLRPPHRITVRGAVWIHWCVDRYWMDRLFRNNWLPNAFWILN